MARDEIILDDNIKAFLKELTKDEKAVEKAIARALFLTGTAVEKMARELLQKGDRVGREFVKKRSQNTGIPYRAYVDQYVNPPAGRRKRASAVGEPPKSDTGSLARSISSEKRAEVNKKMSVDITAGSREVNYAKKLEEDLKRPYMSTAAKKGEAELNRQLDEQLAQVLDGKL